MAAERPSPPSKSPHQHAPGLAPLEYLQLTQRRGSITDPSLHASAHQHQPDQSPPRHSLPNSYRNTSYSFPSNNNKDNLDQSPSQKPAWPANSHAPTHDHDHTMDADPVNSATGRRSAGPDARQNGSPFLPPPTFAATKRKMSHDRQGYNYPEEPPANPGSYPTYAPQDLEGPAAKRRGSTFDTNNRIAHLSLQDRRDSVDSRSSMSGMSGWAGDRRDSAASVYSTTSVGSSVGGYSTAGPGDAKPYWASSGQPTQGSDPNDPHHPQRAYAFPQDPNAPSQPPNYIVNGGPIPSVNYQSSAAAARRLSIPESNLPLNGIKPRTRGGSRASRNVPAAHSEEDIRQGSESTQQGGSPLAQHSNGSSGDLSSPNYPQNLQPPGSSRKETPYSRSPELRVSHKMAERKRRKEMKDLFDELRDQLPADRGMKASKWEILSKAVDYISQLKVAYTDMSAEIERLRGENDGLRGGSGGPSGPYTPHAGLAPGPTPSSANHAPAPAGSGVAPHHNGNHVPARPSSEHSSMSDVRSPSVPIHPLQAQHTGSQQQSPYASHHQTPTPQQPPQPLPSQ